MINDNCLYCNNNETLNSLMIEVAQLKVSTLYLFKEQTYKGRCIVTYKEHGVELHDLNAADLHAYMDDVAQVGRTLQKLFTPEKINYGAYSDKLKHLHMHMVPKYTHGPDFGSVFAMNPQTTYLTDAEYEAIIANIKNNL